jgi:hypothetical protein
MAFFAFWWCFGGVFGERPVRRMTPATRLLRDRLVGKYLHFSKRNKLADDGSFYCLDKYLMEQLGVSNSTIQRARIYLKEAGEIDYVIGKHKGVATRYWITSKGIKMRPFEQDVKGIKMTAKGINLVSKGYQNETLYNKELNKETNKNMPDIPFSFTEEEKEGIRAFSKSYGADQAIKTLADKGYNPESIRQILEDMAPCK